MKKNTLRLLAAILAFSLLAGCGAADSSVPATDDVQQNLFYTLPTVGINWDALEDDLEDDPADTTAPTIPADSIAIENYKLFNGTNVVANDFYPVRYVMIYNPGMYSARGAALSTGTLGTQVEVDLNKGGLDTPTTYIGASQDQLNDDVPIDELVQEGSRAGAVITPYRVGDTKAFYCYDSQSLDNPRIARNFTCRYAGTYCNIWTADTNMSESLIQDYAQQFDSYIYTNVVNTFGQPRFSHNGGKVNLLYYPMPSHIGGCFSLWDLFAYDEVLPQEITAYGINTDHDILHINADFTAYSSMQTFMRSTMAHEFQHLICATNAFETPDLTLCPTWINEAMSGYIEELLYPGVKASGSSHLEAFREGEFIRNGQSLYNFNNTDTDFGVYGSVYLYAMFLANLAGDDVFSNFHKYWRTSYSPTLCDAEALAKSVPAPVYSAVDASIPYPKELTFNTAFEKWMSKLTLQFYLELLDTDSTDPAAFKDVNGRDLLYNQITPTRIEGGGRIIVALQGDSFTIPADADKGLFYIGLDKDFNPVTSLIYY